MTTTVAGDKPDPLHRAAAVGALVALAAALVFLAIATIHRWDVLLAGVLSLGVAVMAAWYVLSRRGAARIAAAVVAVIALAVFLVVMIASESVRILAVGLGLAALSVIAAGYALTSAASVGDAERAPRAQHPVLLMNPRSGGGKVERFGLVELCRQRGIEPYVLRPDDDLRQVTEDAVARGADLLGMAGGDGSLAIVASIASRHGLPFVVVPAGTRNHFALDLGLDRADVPGALDAYDDGVDTPVDLAEINGRVFVNNASMGVYATVVQSADYRDAKMQTAAAMLPDQLGRGAKPLDLRYTLPSGQETVPGQLLLVSNNPYELAHLRGGGSRQHIDGGVLGVVSLRVDGAADAEKLAVLEAAGQIRRFGGWKEWTTAEFEVRSREPVKVGVDGEALVLEPPLHFVSRPGAVTVRLPRAAVRRSPAALTVRVADKPTLVSLWRMATGRPTVSA